MLESAKARAKRFGIPFRLSAQDIVLPKHCPVLGVELKQSKSQGPCDASPTLDRVRPEKGYVRGNVIVVSFRANRIKSNATVRELQKVARFYGRL